MQWQEQGLSHMAENFMPNSTFMSCPKISGVFAPGAFNEQHCTTRAFGAVSKFVWGHLSCQHGHSKPVIHFIPDC